MAEDIQKKIISWLTLFFVRWHVNIIAYWYIEIRSFFFLAVNRGKAILWFWAVLRWVKFWCQQEFCHIWRKVFIWHCIWLWRHGHNNGITDVHHSVEQIRHCVFLRRFPGVIFMESSLLVIPIGKGVASKISLPWTSILCREGGISYHWIS